MTDTILTRRAALKSLASYSALAGVHALMPEYARADGRPTLLRPTSSPAGASIHELEIAETRLRFEGRAATATTINGTVPGPLIRLREGDDAILPTPQVQLQERPQVRTTGPCTASVDFIAARLRAAPTASSPQVASLVPGVPLVINGQVRGADNYIWYRLENYLWVRSDAVLAAGACSNVPTF